MLRITLLLCLATGTLAQVRFRGSCPAATAVTNFNARRFAGKWYEFATYFAKFQLGSRCVTVDFELNDNKTFTVRPNGIGASFDDGKPIVGVAKFNQSTSEAKLMTTFPGLPMFTDTPYWIIGTDYVRWAVAWSCTNRLLHNIQYGWVLTRKQHPSLGTIRAAYAAFKKNKLSRFVLRKTQQTDC